MKILYLTLLAPVLVLSSPAFADQNSCGGSSHLEQVQCVGEHLKELDVALNREYKRALAAMPIRNREDKRKEQEQLRKSQRAWLKYKDENCDLVGGLEGGSNLWVTHYAALCLESEMTKRIEFLKGIADGSTNK